MTLIIAGLGIKFISHLTRETEEIIKSSDKVFYLANDDFYPEWIQSCNSNTESLYSIYFSQSKRIDSYGLIKEKILQELEKYNNIAFIIYGNPNFLVQLTVMLVDTARSKGHRAYVLPAVSSLDCLLADLCINPGDHGMQLFEATALLAYKKIIDPTSHIIIFQPSAIGQSGHDRNQEKIIKGLGLLYDYLSKYYSSDKEIIFYEASQYPGGKSNIIKETIKNITKIEISSKTTIYLSPSNVGELDFEMVVSLRSISADFDAASKKSCIHREVDI